MKTKTYGRINRYKRVLNKIKTWYNNSKRKGIYEIKVPKIEVYF